jgi:hypothetical protein
MGYQARVQQTPFLGFNFKSTIHKTLWITSSVPSDSGSAFELFREQCMNLSSSEHMNLVQNHYNNIFKNEGKIYNLSDFIYNLSLKHVVMW